ncbi:hypothetical protein ACFQY5_27640 [Paeniroseomonas aquatica]
MIRRNSPLLSARLAGLWLTLAVLPGCSLFGIGTASSPRSRPTAWRG